MMIEERDREDDSDSENDLENTKAVDQAPVKSKIIEILLKNVTVLSEKSISAETKKEMIQENRRMIDELEALTKTDLDSEHKALKKLTVIDSRIKKIEEAIKTRQKPVRWPDGRQSGGTPDRNQTICVIEPSSNVSYAAAVKTVQDKGKLIEDKIRLTMTTTKSGKILAKCRSREERDKLMTNLNAEECNVKAREAQGRYEKFIITRLPKNKIDGQPYTDDELEEEMLMRRPDTNLLKASYKRLKSFDAKNGKRVFIISVNSEAARSIESDPYFFVGVETMKAQPKIDLLQCYRCQEYGHVTKDCKLKDDESVCAKCAKTGHRTKDCTSQDKNCICCVRERLDGKGHFAMSDLCPVKRRARQREIESPRK